MGDSNSNSVGEIVLIHVLNMLVQVMTPVVVSSWVAGQIASARCGLPLRVSLSSPRGLGKGGQDD